MSDRVQIGPNVDAELWSRFRESVQSRHGQIRGSLGDELENAIRNYIEHGPDQTTDQQLKEVNERLQRIEAAAGVAASDGGVDTFDADEHTHAPSRVEAAATEKPEPNAATEKKVRYLAECVRDRVGDSSGELHQVPRKHLLETVKDEYGFRRDTAKRYVSELVEFFELRESPDTDGMLMTDAAYQERMETLREQEAANAESELERMGDGDE